MVFLLIGPPTPNILDPPLMALVATKELSLSTSHMSHNQINSQLISL